MIRRRILMVTECLTRGGLETRLLTQARELERKGREVFFATSSREVPSAFRDFAAHIITGLPIDGAASAYQCARAAELLAETIRTRDISIVHGHPFASLVPAAIAAALTERPLTITAHGPESFLGGNNFDAALYDAVLPYAASIRLVSEELRALIPTAVWHKLHIVPNTVDLKAFAPAIRDARGPWAIASRLDGGKIGAIEKFIRWCPALGIPEVHILGAGQEEAGVAALRRDVAGPTRIQMLGWQDDLATLLNRGYAGVAGMGRVVIEAAALQLPCVLLGYRHIHGVVTPARFATFAWSNFSGRGQEPILCEALKRELAQVEDRDLLALRTAVESQHNEANVVLQNMSLFDDAQPGESQRLLQLFGMLRRSDAEDETPWTADASLGKMLPLLSRNPGDASVRWAVQATADRVEEALRSSSLHDLEMQIAGLRTSLGTLTESVHAARYGLTGAALRHLASGAARHLPASVRRRVRPWFNQLAGWGARRAGL